MMCVNALFRRKTCINVDPTRQRQYRQRKPMLLNRERQTVGNWRNIDNIGSRGYQMLLATLASCRALALLMPF